MNERGWDRLLKLIEDGLVVPVLGPQVLIGQDGKGSLQAQIARQLLKFYDDDSGSDALPSFHELNAVVTRLKQNHPIQDLYGDIHDAIEKLMPRDEADIPKSVRQIAAITQFRLFVTLTPED